MVDGGWGMVDRNVMSAGGFALIAAGAALAFFGTTIEVALAGGPDALVFDGEWIGLEWTRWGSLVALPGLAILGCAIAAAPAVREQEPLVKIRLAGIVAIALFWCSFGAAAIVFEMFVPPPARDGWSLIDVYFAPIMEAHRIVARVIRPLPPLVSWYLPFITIIAATVATSVLWLLATSPLVVRANRRRRSDGTSSSRER